MVAKSRTRILTGCGLWLLASFFVLGSTLPGSAENRESVCSEVKNEWEQSVAELKESLREFKSLRKTPVRNIIDQPIVLRNSSKTIAQQVSEGLQAKDRVLDSQREKCAQALNREREVFSKLEACLTESSTSKKPMELFYSCMTCQHTTSEPVVTLLCTECGSQFQPDEAAYRNMDRLVLNRPIAESLIKKVEGTDSEK